MAYTRGMHGMKKIGWQDFRIEITNQLNAYGDAIAKDVNKAVKKTANECRDGIKRDAPVSNKNFPHYRDTWKTRTMTQTNYETSVVVYAQGRGGSLAHLLENGHQDVIHGGRVPGIPHIAPNAERAQVALEERITKIIIEKS